MTDKRTITVTVNGTAATPRRCRSASRLADFIRYELGLTGTHLGCEHGVCGACTILLDGRSARSCLMLAVQADGHEVLTVEGIAPAPDKLHPLQEAFRDNHGLQCGFCTPGMLTTLLEFLRDNPDPTEQEVRVAISGNLCRCTGYQGIVLAALDAAKRMKARASLSTAALSCRRHGAAGNMLRCSHMQPNSRIRPTRLVLEFRKKYDCGERQWRDASSSRCLAWRRLRCRRARRRSRRVAPDSLAGRLVGTWSFASSVNTRKDGSTFDRWGANPKGIFMFDRGGNYSQIIVGSESRVFGAKTFCAFGTYSVDEAKKLLVTRIDVLFGRQAHRHGAEPRHHAADGGRVEILESGHRASGTIAEVLWKRVDLSRRAARQMIACRTLADTHSLTTTVAMITSRISDTCVQASVVIAALSGRPMPPAPTSPSTVDSRMLMSQRNTEMPAKAGMHLRHDAVSRHLRAARAGRAHRLDLALVDLLDRLVQQLGAEADRAQPDREDAGEHARAR